MFDSLKSAATLEREIRDWAFEGYVRLMPANELERFRAHVAESDIQYLIREAVATCVTYTWHAKQMHLFGSELNWDEIKYHDRGIELVKLFAKKKGWEISWGPGPVTQFNVKIDEKSRG